MNAATPDGSGAREGERRSDRPTDPLARGQLALLAVLALLTVGAWGLTVHQAQTMDMPMGVVARGGVDPATEPTAAPTEATQLDAMAGMEGMSVLAAPAEPAGTSMGTASASGMAGMAMDEGWHWDGFVTFLVAWAVMMAAMMFPAAAPMVLLYRSIASNRTTAGRAFVPTWVFVGGYLLVWTAAGALTWVLVQLGGDLAVRLDAADRETWAPIALGATLAVAGLYQSTPAKDFCLRQCQSPLGFVLTRWREGRLGALRMGVVHGAFCLGCCWALFAVLVAAGVMSLAWMLLLTLVVFAEKVLPLGPRAPRAVGVGFLALGVLVAAGVVEMPWTA